MRAKQRFFSKGKVLEFSGPPTKRTLDRLQRVILQVMRGDSFPDGFGCKGKEFRRMSERLEIASRGKWCKAVVGS